MAGQIATPSLFTGYRVMPLEIITILGYGAILVRNRAFGSCTGLNPKRKFPMSGEGFIRDARSARG